METVDTFCYLRDTISTVRRTGESVITRIRCGWDKFSEFLPVLTSKRLSLRRKGTQPVSEVSFSMAVNEKDTKRLERADRAMVRWICPVIFMDMVSSSELSGRLGLKSIEDVMQDKRFRWFGHLQRSGEGSWIIKCRDIKVDGAGKRGKPSKG